MDFERSQTYANLKKAFQGETGACGKYLLYGERAREEDYQQIADIFDETSGNERAHAEIWLKCMNGGEMPSTLENLKDASAGERHEWQVMYRDFAETARQEGYFDIADLFEGVRAIEHSHDARYSKLIKNMETGTVFCKPKEVLWVCLNCGNLIFDTCAPEVCPVCCYPRGYYEINCENY